MDWLALLLLLPLIASSSMEVMEQRNSSLRSRRQLDEPSSRQIDLNITVPFVFSARLYPFGGKNADMELVGEVNEVKLSAPLLFLGHTCDTIWIHRNGLVSLTTDASSTPPAVFPIKSGPPLIAVFWTETSNSNRRIFYRETKDENIFALAQNEVNIQFRYGNAFELESVVVITWQGSAPDSQEEALHAEESEALFQLALILGKNACFVHAIFSRLPSTRAIVALNGPTSDSKVSGEEGEEDGGDDAKVQRQQFVFPGSGTTTAVQVAEKSNIGIPGEWLLRVDEERVFLCGPGFQGLECVDSCLPTQWHMDCSRACHCADGLACNVETGECPDGGKCSPGWHGTPICDEDIDECADDESTICPDEQPDCMNTPGSFLCFCFEYDNATGSCSGLPSVHQSVTNGERARPSVTVEMIPVPVASLSLTPQLSPSASLAAVATRNPLSTEQNRKKPSDAGAFGQTFPVVTVRPITIQPFFGSPPSSPRLAHPKSPPRLQPPSVPQPVEHSKTECRNCAENAICELGKCHCADGWTGDGQNCWDLDECLANSTICGQNAQCQNLPGSYQCICKAGFVASQSGHGCQDVDECSELGETSACVQQYSVCTNTIGGFECQCQAGFSGDLARGGQCLDIDECQQASYFCGRHANCTNLVGSFRCDCHPGFESRPDSNHCRDVDECAQGLCHKAAICTNLEGGFHCECVEGFVGDGRQCHESVLFPLPSTSTGNPTESLHPTSKEIRLHRPLTMCGQPFSSIFVSPKGLLSFGVPFNDSDIESAFQDGNLEDSPPALVPLMANFDAKAGGNIQTLEIDEDELPSNSRGPLSRASLLVGDNFRISDFQVKRLFIVHFGGMSTTNSPAKPNTFQAVIVQVRQNSGGHLPTDSTFVVFLYESVELPSNQLSRAKAGLLCPQLGFHAIPPELMLSASNVGQPGKWIFRVDAEKIFACPSGTLGPPLCKQDCNPGDWGLDCAEHCNCANGLPCDFGSGFCADGKCAPGFMGRNCAEDIDECSLQTHHCSVNATCSNLAGSYSCNCKPKYTGDGFNCTMLDPCVMRFNAKCTENAHCDAINEEMPECVCNEGFHGDGRRECRANVLTTSATSPSTVSHASPTTSHQFKAPFATNTHNQPIKTTTSSTIITSSNRWPPSFRDGKAETEQTGKTPDTTNDAGLISAATESGTLILIVCSVLGSTWLVVVLIFSLIYCFRKRRRSRQSEYSPSNPQMLGWTSTRTLNPNSSVYFSSTKFG